MGDVVELLEWLSSFADTDRLKRRSRCLPERFDVFAL